MSKSTADILIEQIVELSNKLYEYQNGCSHDKVIKEFEMDYFEDSDLYNCYCPTCKKRWVEDI